MKSRIRRRVLSVSLVAFFLSSCTEVQRMRIDGRPCERTTFATVNLFLEAISVTSLSLLRKAVPESWSVWAIFGKGSISQGQINVHEIVRYLGAGRDDAVGISYDLIEPIGNTDVAEIKIVTIKRTVEIIRAGKKEDDAEYEFYRRSFRVTFVPLTNCIMDVQSIEDQWVRIKS